MSFFVRFKKWANGAAQTHGALIAVLCAAPALSYFGIQAPSGEFSGLMKVDGPTSSAVRSISGPKLVRVMREAKSQVTVPQTVKGLYVSAPGASSQKLFGEILNIVDRTEVNSLVIDVKGENGGLAFETENPLLTPNIGTNYLGKLSEFTAPLKEKGIYLIARVFVFQDPYLAKSRPELAVADSAGGVWKDRKGVTWVDPASEEVWAYNVAVAREVVAGGFDEVQFDYVRFPTDGAISRMRFPVWDGVEPKTSVMSRFYSYLNEELRQKSGIRTSIDLFGLVTNLHDSDLNIGQRLDIAARKFDWISPMVYPSHYPPGYLDYSNPADHPYEVVRNAMDGVKPVTDPLYAEDKAAKEAGRHDQPAARMRPWLQDFDLGAEYTPEMIRAQIRAAMDAGSGGWLLWNARNVYTEAALEPEATLDSSGT